MAGTWYEEGRHHDIHTSLLTILQALLPLDLRLGKVSQLRPSGGLAGSDSGRFSDAHSRYRFPMCRPGFDHRSLPFFEARFPEPHG